MVECLAPEAVVRSQQWDGNVWGLCSALGMVLGGVMVAMWGTTACFLLDAGCRLLSAACLLCMDTRPAGWAEVRTPIRTLNTLTERREDLCESLRTPRDAHVTLAP